MYLLTDKAFGLIFLVSFILLPQKGIWRWDCIVFPWEEQYLQ